MKDSCAVRVSGYNLPKRMYTYLSLTKKSNKSDCRLKSSCFMNALIINKMIKFNKM